MTRRIEKSGRRNTVDGIRGLIFALYTLCCLPSTAFAATKIFLHDAASKLDQSSAIDFRLANATQGSAKVTAVINSIGGAVSGQYWPSSTTGHILTKTAGGTKTVWFSAPLSSGVTISSTVTPNFWGLESNGQCNCGFRYEVLRWSVAAGGIVSSLGISTDNGATEWGTSAAVRTAPTLSPTSTAFVTGDRIVMVIYNDDGNGVTEGSGRTWTLDYDAATGVDGDTYLSFTETISFSADTNNARPIPLTASTFQSRVLAWGRDYWREETRNSKLEIRHSSRPQLLFSSLDFCGLDDSLRSYETGGNHAKR
jgi:hypothetical protein